MFMSSKQAAVSMLLIAPAVKYDLLVLITLNYQQD